MYLDESGDHSLTAINPEYPIFVLGGIIVDQEYAEGPMTELVNQFKREFFGREDIILHTADITRARNGFEALQDPAFREAFYNGLNELMRRLDYRVIACAIKKLEHRAQYGDDALDPYFYSLGCWWKDLVWISEGEDM